EDFFYIFFSWRPWLSWRSWRDDTESSNTLNSISSLASAHTSAKLGLRGESLFPQLNAGQEFLEGCFLLRNCAGGAEHLEEVGLALFFGLANDHSLGIGAGGGWAGKIIDRPGALAEDGRSDIPRLGRSHIGQTHLAMPAIEVVCQAPEIAGGEGRDLNLDRAACRFESRQQRTVSALGCPIRRHLPFNARRRCIRGRGRSRGRGSG